MEARLARPTDVVKRTRYILPDHFVGYVFEDDGKWVGMAMALWDKDNRPFLFFEIADEARGWKFKIGRWSARFVDAMKAVCDELYVMEDQDEPGSTRWIEWLGFRATDEIINGHRVMRYDRN